MSSSWLGLRLSRAGVPPHQYKECMEWAFGKGWESILCSQMNEVWNKTHPDLTQLKSSDSVVYVFKVIGKAFLERKV